MADQTVDQTVTGPSDTFKKLQGKLGQLSALLNCGYGWGIENFRSMIDAIQNNYLWACADLSKECELITKNLMQKACAHKKASIKVEGAPA
jgi:hypothetical protein